MDCAEVLMKNIDDGKVMEIWMEAVKFNNAVLCETAIKGLVVRPKGKPLREVPAFTETFESTDGPLGDDCRCVSPGRKEPLHSLS